MNKIILVLGFVALASCRLITPEFVNHINSIQNQWVATADNQFAHMSEDELKAMLACKIDVNESKYPKISYKELLEFTGVPDAFDSRTQWPNCAHAILDQGRCGSCWAFGASEAHTDRVCIATKGASNNVLSSQDLVSCDTGNYGCNGGYLDETWDYIQRSGIVTEACWPYSSGGGAVEKCRTSCKSGETWKKFKGKNVRQFYTANDAKLDILTNGPVETGFLVYQDFMSYKSGIYKHTSGKLLGGHAIKVLGWGVEGGVKFWIAANSWATKWGENGFFRIQEGQCQFDDNMIVADPVV